MTGGASWGYGVAIFLFIMFFISSFYKPECRAGYVPTMAMGTGWYCAPGYKP